MASNTNVTRKRRKIRHSNMGKIRKKQSAKRSTISYEELFAQCGAPGVAAAAGK